MCHRSEPNKQECRRGFLRALDDEPELRRLADLQEQLLKMMGDVRCACAPTCPFHHLPGQELSPVRARAPWDES